MAKSPPALTVLALACTSPFAATTAAQIHASHDGWVPAAVTTSLGGYAPVLSAPLFVIGYRAELELAASESPAGTSRDLAARFAATAAAGRHRPGQQARRPRQSATRRPGPAATSRP